MKSRKPMTTISAKKVEANRRNSLRSTGPISRMGKCNVRWNALKHGLFAGGIIPIVDGKNAVKEYAFLLKKLQEALRPVGALEQIMVEKIAVCYFRLGRALRAERGETEKYINLPVFEDLEAQEASEYRTEPSYEVAKRTSTGVAFAMSLLERAIERLKTHGFLDEINQSCVSEIFGGDFSLVKNLTDQASGQATPEQIKDLVLSILSEKKQELEKREKILQENECHHSNAVNATCCIPPEEEAERLLRYENSIERQLYRASIHLERLQRQRKGEFLPMPMLE